MSHIPNSAMPHAGPTEETQQEQGGSATLSERAGKLAEQAGDLVYNHPRKIAAGAALAAGVVAAAAIPLVRGRSSDSKKRGDAKNTSDKKS